jgi:hypothetical protein
MGFSLGGILKSVAKFAIPIAANFIGGPLAGIATKLLQGVADKFIGQGKSLVDGLLDKIPFGLGSPLKSLADKLIGGLQSKVDGGIESLVHKIATSIVKRLTGDGVSVTPPALGSKERAETSTSAGASVINDIKSGATGYPATGNSSSGSLLDEIGSFPKKPTMPSDPKDDRAMMKYQEEMQAYNRMITMLTNVLQMRHESNKAIVSNLRG